MTKAHHPPMLPPRTPLEAFESFPQGTRVELINNTLYMPPAPDLPHQRTSRDLGTEILLFLRASKKGEMFYAPVDVYLGDRKNAVQPDLVIILQENLEKLTADHRRITGVPDIIIEILSEDRKYDLETKKALYERFGVKEYFVIEPETALAYHFFLQKGGRYELVHQHIRKLESRLLGHTFGW